MNGNLRSNKVGGDSQEKYTLNFDGSHNNQVNKVGAGCIIRDDQGELVVAASYNLSKEFSEYCDVAIAEAAALRNGLKLAKEFNIKPNLIRGDSQEVINHVVLGCKSSKRSFKKYLKGVKQPLSGIIKQIVGMLDRSQKIKLINREANQVADKLASLGSSKLQRGRKQLFNADADLPPQVAKLIMKEKSLSSKDKELKEDEGEGSSMVENVVRDELIKQISDILVRHSQKTNELVNREVNQVAAKSVLSASNNKLQGGHKFVIACNADPPPPPPLQVCNTPHVTSAGTCSHKTGTPIDVELKCGHNLPAKLCVSKKEGKRFYGCSLWPKTCGFLVWEDELLEEDEVCKKCDELQAKLMEQEKRIADLNVEVRFLVNQKLKLEEKKGSMEKSMNMMNDELCQMRDEKKKAEKKEKYESIAVVVIWILFLIIYFRV